MNDRDPGASSRRESDEAVRHARQAAAGLDAQSCPALAEFVSAYLHEELALEHGSAAEAAWAYCHEASSEEVAALAREWELLEAVARHLPIAETDELLATRFGSAWRPITVSEVSAVGAELRAALADPLDAD